MPDISAIKINGTEYGLGTDITKVKVNNREYALFSDITMLKVNDTFYDLIDGSGLKIVSWAKGTDAEIAAMIAAADAGEIDLHDYWNVGEERVVHLSSVGSDIREEDATFVLMDKDIYTLADTLISGKETCNFVVGMKNCLTIRKYAYTNSNDSYYYDWDNSYIYGFLNNIFPSSLPSSFLNMFKKFKYNAEEHYRNNIYNFVRAGLFTIPSLKEVTGTELYTVNPDTQLEYYKNPDNRKKKQGDSGSYIEWLTRSHKKELGHNMYTIYTSGNYTYEKVYVACGISVIGCI